MADNGDLIPRDDSESQRMLALRFALGLLEGDEHERAIGLYERSAAFAAQVAEHEERLFALADPLPQAEGASSMNWHRIAAMLSAAPGPAQQVPLAVNDDDVAPRRLIARTAGLTALLCLATGALLWRLDLMPRRGPIPVPAETSIAVAQISADNEPVIAIAYDRGLGKLTARFLPSLAQGQVPELWLIGADGKPRSLGFAQPGKSIRIVIPPELRGALMHGAVIAVSLEAPSAVPHSAPAGPILGTAKISEI